MAQRKEWLEISRLTGCEVMAVVFEAGASACVERVMLRCAENVRILKHLVNALVLYIGEDTLPSSQGLVWRV